MIDRLAHVPGRGALWYSLIDLIFFGIGSELLIL